jgi:hypothetical protein
VTAYIDAARRQRIYLQPGQRVTIHVERMGVIDSLIVE